MKIMEYKGKEILSNYGIPIQKGVVIDSIDEIKEKVKNLKPPFVVKVQILAGGRGKAGGIKFADDVGSAYMVCKDLLGTIIRGHVVKKILIAEKVDVNDEWYLSVILDRYYKSPMIIFSSLGGIDIEETAKSNLDKIIKIPVNPITGIKDYFVGYIFNKCKINNIFKYQFFPILNGIYKLFNEYDCTLAEINPLSIVNGSNLMAIDCKMDIDDSALYRHADILEFRNSLDENPLTVEARKFNFLYIPLSNDGDIAVMSNGSGILMSCIDLISKSGLKVGAVLDLGGGASSDRISEAVKIIFRNKNINYLLVSIFGGITRCSEVANGVKIAVESGLEDKTLVLRLEGTNKQAAMEILSNVDGKVIVADSISEGVKILNSRR